MDTCPYFYYCIRNHNGFTSNCLVRKGNIRGNTTTYWPRICGSFRNSSSFSRWYQTPFERKPSSISRGYSLIPYRTFHSSDIRFSKLFSNSFWL
nr:hypothetical protein C5167_021499 [Ipomoea trifida]GLL25355.1 hypothetical protein C5167_021499 [Ipomoea trifida]GLL39785.1 hypothetical protein C5167_021499 [Ipomoea trifida]GLL41354.1 hypothetical protein C5167_021499 [Ipomoea trifida]GME15824.1 NADH dehydrogenase 49 kDa subunit [Ipomoea batatas]